jgi:radical SAM protein with 4Fe4S-binding SPASM domain
MSQADFKKSINFITDYVFPRIGIGKSHTLTVEYLGGEVLLVPARELVENVTYVRDKMTPLVRRLRDGAQSNLIGSPRKILDLHDLFDGNLGTSWDQHTDQRQLKGSAQLYRAILNTSLRHLRQERNHKTGRVIVLDENTLPHLNKEVEDAIQGGYDLVIRPVFLGGSDDIEPAKISDLQLAMASAYKIWSDSKTCRIEPFYSLHHRRKNRGTPKALSMAGCPFQSECAQRSLSLDPDGTLHICQEMADSSNYPLGNAIKGEFDEKTWRLLSRRTIHLSDECSACSWKSECGGGCMNESILQSGDPFARTELCPVWKTIFHEIDQDIFRGLT